MTTFDQERLQRFDAWMQRYVEEGKFPGASLLLSQGGKPVHRAATGWRDVAAQRPFENDTIVRIFSMTKPITSVALMMLAERGLFHLDAPVSAFLPEFADCRALVPGATRPDQTAPCPSPTLHQLATHTSGLTYSFNPGIASILYREQALDFAPDGPGLATATARIAAAPLAFAPGSAWEYSVGIDVLGRVIEVITGKPLDQVFAEEIFAPLGMTDTHFSIPDAKLDRLACLYTAHADNPMALGTRASGAPIRRETDRPETSQWRRTKTFSGGGGLLSTLDDYARFAEMLRRGGTAADGTRLLSPATLRFMMRNHLPGDIASMGPKSFAEMPMDGMGFGIGGSVVLDPARARMAGNAGDFGWGGMASTFFWVDPIADLTCVFLTQLTPSSSYPNRAELKALIYGAMTA